MAVADKTTFWPFTTRLTNLATNTTLGTATRHDFAAITIDVPENTPESVTFKSVKLRVTARDVFTAATDLDQWRLGIKLGSVAFDDVDYTTAAANTADHEEFILERDVTAYFIANFGTGASQTCQVGVAFATGAASNVNNITAELWITYDYDNTIATQCKSVEILIQGHHTTLPTTDTEIGATGGTSNAAANQIPDLSTYCPEAGKTFKKVYLRITANDAGAAATAFNLFVQIDSGGTEDTRATLDQTQITGVPYRDIVDLLASPHSMTTNAVHALICRSSLATTFENISAVLVATYTFTVSGTTRELHSCRVPLVNERSGISPSIGLTGDEERLAATIDIQEPGTITLLANSGTVIFDQMMGVNGITLAVYATGQGVRTYGHANVNRSGPHIYTRRHDHDSSQWTSPAIVRGLNRLYVNLRAGGTGNADDVSGYAIVNYTADIPPSGIGTGNRTVAYCLTSHPTPGSGVTIISAEERLPTFPMAPWLVSGAWVELGIRALMSTVGAAIQAERKSGEDAAAGWYTSNLISGNTAELGRREMIRPLTWIRDASYRTQGMNPLVTRRWRASVGTSAANFEWCGSLWLTVHGCKFTVAGTVTIDGAAAPNSKPVLVLAFDAGLVAESVATVLTTGGTGAYTAEVTDDTRAYFSVYEDASPTPDVVGRSLTKVPEVDAFDIVIFTTGGTPTPVLSNIDPDPGENPGDPGAFSVDFRTARLTPIEFDITGIGSGCKITISVHYDDRNETYTALDVDGVFRWPFDVAADNVIGSLSSPPVHVRILPRGGWPPTVVRFQVANAKASA